MKTIINETYKNLLTRNQKERYVDEVWDVLQRSYADIGGLKGKGFETKEDMIVSIPFWKISLRDDEVVACLLYKNKGGRKTVAIGTNGTRQGVGDLAKMLKEEFSQQRSYTELSGPALKFTRKILGDEFHQYVIPPEEAMKILGVNDLNIVNDEEYSRNINGHDMTKVMMGTPGNEIVETFKRMR